MISTYADLFFLFSGNIFICYTSRKSPFSLIIFPIVILVFNISSGFLYWAILLKSHNFHYPELCDQNYLQLLWTFCICKVFALSPKSIFLDCFKSTFSAFKYCISYVLVLVEKFSCWYINFPATLIKEMTKNYLRRKGFISYLVYHPGNLAETQGKNWNRDDGAKQTTGSDYLLGNTTNPNILASPLAITINKMP